MKKVFLFLLTTFVFIFTLIGCDDSTLEIEPGADVITIYIRHFEDWSDEYFINSINKYNENLEDGVHVNYLLLDESVYQDKISADREAGNAPDFYLCSWAPLWAEVQNNYITPLENYFSEDFFNDYTDTAKEYTTLYDKIYAVPYCFEPSIMLFYSKSWFKTAGITEEPKTYEEMLECCEKLSKVIDKTMTVLGTPLAYNTGWATAGQLWNAAGGNYPISDDWSTSLVGTTNKQGYKKYLEYWTSLYKLGYASRSDVAGGYNEIINELCEGKVAMTFAGSYAIGAIVQDYILEGYMDDLDDIGCCLAPSLNQEIGATTNGGWSFVIDTAATSRACTNEKNAGKTHANLAAEFLNWYTRTPEIAGGWFEMGMCCKQTGFKSIQEHLDLTQTENPFYEVIKTAANTSSPTYYFPYMNDYCAQMIQTLMKPTNTKSIDEVIAECDYKVKSCIDTYKLSGKNPK